MLKQVTSVRRGNTYLAFKNGAWYIIQQVSHRKWVATCFTHTMDFSKHEPSYTTDGKDMGVEGMEWTMMYEFPYGENGQMRKAMFNILKTGKAEQ